jgi:hypothetical protein
LRIQRGPGLLQRRVVVDGGLDRVLEAVPLRNQLQPGLVHLGQVIPEIVDLRLQVSNRIFGPLALLADEQQLLFGRAELDL